jgi:hypothetical protein
MAMAGFGIVRIKVLKSLSVCGGCDKETSIKLFSEVQQETNSE